MRKRTFSRELALQALYEADTKKISAALLLREFWKKYPECLRDSESFSLILGKSVEAEVKEYTEKLINGIFRYTAEIDAVIERFAENWEMSRMAYVDRNILRLATFEILHGQDVPPNVVINEAVELAKRYGDPESSKFINGIMDKIARTLSKEAIARETAAKALKTPRVLKAPKVTKAKKKVKKSS